MKIQALLMAPTDNVVTCIIPVSAGETVAYQDGEEIKTVLALEDIPYCHKIALCDMAAETAVIKYGEMIGKTNAFVPKGGWVSHENIYSVYRDYQSELISEE